METHNHELARALVRRGHEVTLAGFCGDLAGEPPGLHVRSLGDLGGRLYNREGKRSTRQALRFAAAAARFDLGPYDVVETPNMPYVHLLPLAARCRRAGKPLVVTWFEHWGAYWREYVGAAKAPAYRAVEWATAQLGTVATATSRLTAERLAAARRRGGVELVPCGIEVARVRAAAADAEPGAPPLLFAGRLIAHKRLPLLLATVRRLAAAMPGPEPLLTVFGEGPERERLEGLARELGVEGRVRFRGHVERSEEVWRAMGGARIAVQPSGREGFGLFPLEAMAAGLPVVYCESAESAVPELVRDGVEGVCCAPTAEALASTLERLLVDDDERGRLADGARARAELYDWEEIARRFEEIFGSLVRRA
ncbi:MAG TPA: glycosyltransferase family 4 protein [Thermoanaerobaculia bacterium]|nr:glycosyltransferase family 4 protein [Thermoanaerobaculia bacterium]